MIMHFGVPSTRFSPASRSAINPPLEKGKRFNDDFSVLETRFAFAPAVPIFTPVDELGDQDYMRIAAGLSFELPSKVALGLSAEGRVFGQERDSYRLAGELSIPF